MGYSASMYNILTMQNDLPWVRRCQEPRHWWESCCSVWLQPWPGQLQADLPWELPHSCTCTSFLKQTLGLEAGITWSAVDCLSSFVGRQQLVVIYLWKTNHVVIYTCFFTCFHIQQGIPHTLITVMPILDLTSSPVFFSLEILQKSDVSCLLQQNKTSTSKNTFS